MKATTGMKIKAYRGDCIGIIIQATTWTGTIIKVNKKSIRVKLEESVTTYGKRLIHKGAADQDVTYRFWKTTSDGRELYRSECRLYGIIEL